MRFYIVWNYKLHLFSLKPTQYLPPFRPPFLPPSLPHSLTHPPPSSPRCTTRPQPTWVRLCSTPPRHTRLCLVSSASHPPRPTSGGGAWLDHHPSEVSRDPTNHCLVFVLYVFRVIECFIVFYYLNILVLFWTNLPFVNQKPWKEPWNLFSHIVVITNLFSKNVVALSIDLLLWSLHFVTQKWIMTFLNNKVHINNRVYVWLSILLN